MSKKTKLYSIRPLVGSDFFLISKFLQTADISRIQKIISMQDFSSAVSVMGGKNSIDLMEIARLLVGGASTAVDTICDMEEALPELLSKVSNLTKEQVKSLPLDDFIYMAMDLFKQPTFVAFYKRIQELFAKQKGNMNIKMAAVPAVAATTKAPELTMPII